MYQYPSMWNAIRSIIKEQGIRGLFAGYGATMLRDAPYAGLYVLFYEQFKQLGKHSSLETSMVHLGSGMMAGFLATSLVHPFDVLKTRIQVRPQEYTHLFQAIQKMIQVEMFLFTIRPNLFIVFFLVSFLEQ